MDGVPTPTTPDGDAEVIELHARRRLPEASGAPAESLEAAIAELGGRTALQSLAAAYADRLTLLRGGADAEELAASAALIATLERACLRQP